jgi:hypothetical protein
MERGIVVEVCTDNKENRFEDDNNSRMLISSIILGMICINF